MIKKREGIEALQIHNALLLVTSSKAKGIGIVFQPSHDGGTVESVPKPCMLGLIRACS